MTSIEINFQNMKENDFQKPTEPPGLVQAFLELDEGSDEEFLDFQFRIADANANLQEREASDNMADWRASFASLQLKQAHEVAEFALARRREDELRIDRQAKEIIELRRTLEASRLETEQVKASFAVITEEKLKLEEELANRVLICESFIENAAELSEAQERMSSENMELKRSLDDAVVTTSRLKVALEEKAAELVAWLGHDGLAPQELSTLTSDDELSPRAEEKKAYCVQAMETNGLEDNQKLETLFTENDSLEGIVADETSNARDYLSTSSTEKTISGVDEEVEDMKQVLLGTSESSGSRADAGDTSSPPQKYSGIGLQGAGRALHILSSEENEVIVTLNQKIEELQLKLERLQSVESTLDEQQSNKGTWHCNVKKSLFQTSVFYEVDGHQDTKRRLHDSSSTGSNYPSREGEGPALTGSSSDYDACIDAAVARDQVSGEGQPDESAAEAVLSVVNEALSPAMTELEFSDSFASLENSEVATIDYQNHLEDKFVCVSRNHPWAIVSISNFVESMTEELIKLLKVVAKTCNASCQNTFTDLETRFKSWSFVTPKALQSKVSRDGAVEEWKDLVVDFLSQSRQELMGVQQRLCDCESELALMDKLQAECLAASQSNSLLTDEIHRLEAESFSDHIESEGEVDLLKAELEQAKQVIAEASKSSSEEQQIVDSLREQLRNSEIELENSKLGWVAEQEFINSCFEGGREELDKDKVVSMEEMGRMEKKLEALILRLEENDRELGELLIISGVDPDAVVSAKIRRLEQRLDDAKESEQVLVADKAELAAELDFLKVKLAEVEYELHLESQQHVEMLLRYEEEQGHFEATTRSETGLVSAKLLEVEHLLAEKTKQLELAQEGQNLSASQTQLLTLRARILTLESNLAITRQKAVNCEAAIKSQINKEKEKYANLESKYVPLQSNYAALKMLNSDSEQRERLAQINIDKLMVELGIAKEEVLRYEVRLQKTVRQAKEDVEAEKREHEETLSSQKQMEWHLCRQLELTEGLEREKTKIREVLVEFELQNLSLQKECDNLRSAYMQLARQAD